ncbi:MAG: cytidine deaminase [Prevotella sp.]|nr:cytidine deaminase [Prevotella sp.]MDD7273043.1 cytidine deaminase [Prevotellaceae bacterium]MDY3935708.1 cytidine deaminase [Prevotella sp.]MDY4218073.1 cytidine deaminase [Prevotella sp.]
MKTIEFNLRITFCLLEELSEGDQALLKQAMDATRNSYSPYSRFAVGAALRLANNTIVQGANQENAAFPSGLCAERAAIFAAQSVSPEQAITDIAIAAHNGGGFTKQPIVPCGACRQVILEMEDRYQRPVRLLLYGTEGVYVINSVKDILPLQFVGDSMK